MNKQEIFNKVVRGLAKQGFWRSMRKFNTDNIAKCAYRGSRGKRCAAGILITDAAYSRAFETKAATAVDVVAALVESGIQKRQILTVHALQECHDQGKSPKEMKDYLIIFANKNRLKAPRSLGAR